MNALDKGAPMPATIGGCADLYNEVHTLRLAMDKEVAAVKERESEIKAYIIDNLSRTADTGAAGLRYRAQLTEKEGTRIADWGVFTSWVRKNDRFDCIQKRVNKTAIKDLWAEREEVPGLEKMIVKDVSITKI